MSLLGHLVRVTLAPEQAARPALPQQFANWGEAGSTDDEEWGEEAGTPEASRPAPRRAPAQDDSPAARSHSSPAEPQPEPNREMPRRAARRAPAESPEIVASSPLPVQQSRGTEPMIETQARRMPDPMAEKPPARMAPIRSALPQPEAPAGEAPSPRRGRQTRPVELPAFELARAAPPARAVEPAATMSEAAEPSRAIVPAIVSPPVDMPSQPARHDRPAPVDARASPSAPDPRRDPVRLEEPRIVAPIARETAPALALQSAVPLVVPAAAPSPAATPMLATPQVTLPEPAPAQPQLPDVHISIGRVEVRAAAAPPRPAQREAPARSETLSLDAYLSRRNGSAR